MPKSLLTILLVIYIVQCAKLPKHWKKCKRDDPNMNECLRVAMTFATRDLKNGNPSLGVLPLDPLRIDELVIDQGQGPVSLKMSFHNFNIYGYKDIQVVSVNTDWKDAYINTVTPKLTIRGKYKMDGRVLTIPIKGEGNCLLDWDNFTTSLHLTLRNYTKNGKEYYTVDKFDMTKVEADKGRMHFENLFNGDKNLGDSINRFLNENWREILKSITPALSKSFGLAYKQISNTILSRVSVDELFQH